MLQTIKKELNSHLKTIESVIDSCEKDLQEAAKLIVKTINNGNKILLFGNGGSAADAQHIAAEFTGRYKTDRKALAAIALTTDTSALSAIGNDFGFSQVFVRQVEALAKENDLLIAISTSGTSLNVIEALKLGKTLGCKSIGFLGKGGGFIKDICDVNLIVPSDDTPRIQEMHILFGHILCQIVDENFS